MSTASPQPGPSADGSQKPFSCLVCRQRKVKCNRSWPCQNCTRAQIDCEYVSPVRGKRARTAAPREGLHAKMRRYENLLKTRGVSLDDDKETPTVVSDAASQKSRAGNDDTVQTPVSLPVLTPREVSELPLGLRSSLITAPGSQPELVNKQGSSRYYERYVLAAISALPTF